MKNTVIDGLLKYRWLFFVASIALLVFMASGFKHFVFDASPRIYFEEGFGPYEDFLEMEDTYGRDFKVFIMLSAREGDVFEPTHLQALNELTEQSWLLPFVSRVDSLSNFQFTYSQDDELFIEDLFSQELINNANIIDTRKQFALSSKETVSRLVSPDGKHAAVILSLYMTGDQAQGEDAKNLIDKVYQLEETLKEKYPTIDIAVTGNLASSYHNVIVATKDITLMVPVMFGLMFLFLGLLLRSASTIVVALTVAVFSSVGALGLGAWFGITYSMLAINALIIGITVAVAHCIHIFTQMFHELKTQTKMDALSSSLKINFYAVSMTSLTTVIGFLSLNTNDLPPAVALGNAAAIGTALAWLFSFTMLPALVSILPFKQPQTSELFIERQMSKIAEFIIHRKYAVLIVMTALTVLMIGLSFSNQLNDRLTETLHEPHIFRSDNTAIDKHFGALYIHNYDMNAGEENGIADPVFLNEMDKFAQYLRAQPEVTSVYAFSDIIKRLNQSMHNDDPRFYTIPQSRELIAQYILLYEMSVPYGLDLSNQITQDKSKSLVIVGLPCQDTSDDIALDQRIKAWISTNLPEKYQAKNISISTIWSYLTFDSLKNSLQGSTLALTLISIVLLFLLRSLRYGVISLIPNILPAVFGFGFWYLYSGNVGLALTCVIIITIGIVVDDTVHFLVKYQKALKDQKGDAEEAIRITFKQVGPALFITTLVLAAGFSVLGLSQIIINSALGQVTTVILIAAFFLDILLLPALLLIIDGKKNKNQ